MIFHNPWTSRILLKGSEGRVTQVSGDCPMNHCFFVWWIPPPPQFSHPCSSWLFQLYRASRGNPARASLVIPSAPPTERQAVESIVLEVWWWGREVTSRQEAVRAGCPRAVSGAHHPRSCQWQPPCLGRSLPGLVPLSLIQALRLRQGLTIENPEVPLRCKIEKCKCHPFFDTSHQDEPWYLHLQSAKSQLK